MYKAIDYVHLLCPSPTFVEKERDSTTGSKATKIINFHKNVSENTLGNYTKHVNYPGSHWSTMVFSMDIPIDQDIFIPKNFC